MKSAKVDRLTKSWADRAAVRSPKWTDGPVPKFDLSMRDFPEGLLPFCEHPSYCSLPMETKFLVETFAWVAWNKRVVDTEELLVAPALHELLSGVMGIDLFGHERAAIRQTIIDEYFHSHMHEVAVGVTLEGRRIPMDAIKRFDKPSGCVRTCREFVANIAEPWKRSIAQLAWVIVGELSIYEFLGLVSQDTTIQPFSRRMLELHERDEGAHAFVIADVIRNRFLDFSRPQRSFLLECLPIAMQAFSETDWQVWRQVLLAAEVEKANAIISDMEKGVKRASDSGQLLRSYSNIERLSAELTALESELVRYA